MNPMDQSGGTPAVADLTLAVLVADLAHGVKRHHAQQASLHRAHKDSGKEDDFVPWTSLAHLTCAQTCSRTQGNFILSVPVPIRPIGSMGSKSTMTSKASLHRPCSISAGEWTTFSRCLHQNACRATVTCKPI